LLLIHIYQFKLTYRHFISFLLPTVNLMLQFATTLSQFPPRWHLSLILFHSSWHLLSLLSILAPSLFPYYSSPESDLISCFQPCSVKIRPSPLSLLSPPSGTRSSRRTSVPWIVMTTTAWKKPERVFPSKIDDHDYECAWIKKENATVSDPHKRETLKRKKREEIVLAFKVTLIFLFFSFSQF
jgi:hypothetical protein